jgi:hypothetical protein
MGHSIRFCPCVGVVAHGRKVRGVFDSGCGGVFGWLPGVGSFYAFRVYVVVRVPMVLMISSPCEQCSSSGVLSIMATRMR